MTKTQAYKTLNISEQATSEQIKKAYKTMAKKYHPDIYQGDKKLAEEKMKQINEAYDLLCNKSTTDYSSSYSSKYEAEYRRRREEAEREFEEELRRIHEEAEKMREEAEKMREEENKKLARAFKPIFILMIISLAIASIFLFTTLVTSAISYFNQANWFFFGFQIIWLIAAVPFCFFCFAGLVYIWKNAFK